MPALQQIRCRGQLYAHAQHTVVGMHHIANANNTSTARHNHYQHYHHSDYRGNYTDVFNKDSYCPSYCPHKKITDAAYNIAAGNLNTPLPEIETDNEFRRLRDAFAHMQQSLKTYIERLTETTRHQQRTDSELEIAQKIQLDMLPKTFPPYPDHDEFDIYSRLITARMIGGDFYDFHLRDNKLFFVIGDVAGKGVPASIIMAVSRSMFKSALSQTTSPAHIISIINDSLAENNAQNMFVTMICGVLNLADGHLCYCSAGHNAPLIWDNEKGTHALPCLPNIPAGLFGGYAYENQTTKLVPGQK